MKAGTFIEPWRRLKRYVKELLRRFDTATDERNRYLNDGPIARILADFRQRKDPWRFGLGTKDEQDLFAEISLFKRADLCIQVSRRSKETIKVNGTEALVSKSREGRGL